MVLLLPVSCPPARSSCSFLPPLSCGASERFLWFLSISFVSSLGVPLCSVISVVASGFTVRDPTSCRALKTLYATASHVLSLHMLQTLGYFCLNSQSSFKETQIVRDTPVCPLPGGRHLGAPHSLVRPSVRPSASLAFCLWAWRNRPVVRACCGRFLLAAEWLGGRLDLPFTSESCFSGYRMLACQLFHLLPLYRRCPCAERVPFSDADFKKFFESRVLSKVAMVCLHIVLFLFVVLVLGFQ